jgi:ubiquinone/menaquinone biosynthesis C-methylase UbiE
MATNVRDVYNEWSNTYDEIENKTRDLDRVATQTVLEKIIDSSTLVLELGCGTGKNTAWLLNKAQHVTAVDFSEHMLNKAKEKYSDANLIFLQADITQPWPFETDSFNLVTCNLILEHIKTLDSVFSEAARILKDDSYFFISELHPAKQYLGSKARFEKNNELVSPDCFIHHTSEYFSSAINNGFSCIELMEWFDDNNTQLVPRLISFLFKKMT